MRQARLRDEVLETWGFGRLCRMGRGINALFAGPSGTGKTMAAQVLARELDRELCRVDLAEVVNKYIGETEKTAEARFRNLRARAGGVVLRRSRCAVRPAHAGQGRPRPLRQYSDRLPVAAHGAVRRRGHTGHEPEKRPRFRVPAPAAIHRRFPGAGRAGTAGVVAAGFAGQHSPAAEELLQEIAWEWLADKLLLTGAEIKAIALAAAFLARADGARIRMHHLAHATRREMAKHGTPWRAGDWSGIRHA